ncbi:unannotated protein [freshwater metagenome]|uniref:Unannotated protein n=1 Tax=freshwater metagenome TaxID=449393 RepID=A0A6J7RKX7_9ZZZZ
MGQREQRHGDIAGESNRLERQSLPEREQRRVGAQGEQRRDETDYGQRPDPDEGHGVDHDFFQAGTVGKAPDECGESEEQGECHEVDSRPSDGDDHQRDRGVEYDLLPFSTKPPQPFELTAAD